MTRIHQTANLRKIDLRSDTVTQADPGMRAAMADAKVGDSMFNEDPSVRALEERLSQLFGFPYAVFVPTGTMSNQLLLRSQTEPGDAVVADLSNHIVQYESGALAALCGLQLLPAELQEAGFPQIDVGCLKMLMSTDREFYRPRTRVVAIEDTHMGKAGRIYGWNQLLELSSECRRMGLRLHCDGARIWHSLVSDSNYQVERIGSLLDSLSVCLSKGLGAPMGSCALFHEESMLLRFKRFQKMFGGCMRQLGHMAAAAEYALCNNLGKLSQTHERARTFADQIACVDTQLKVDWGGTNIVFLHHPDAFAFAQRMLDNYGIGLSVLSPNLARAVFHIDILSVEMPALPRQIQS